MLTDDERLSLLEIANLGRYLPGYSSAWMCSMGFAKRTPIGHELTLIGREELNRLRAKAKEVNANG